MLLPNCAENVLKTGRNVLGMLDKTSRYCIRSVLYVLYVLKPAKSADFSMIGRF